MTIRWLPARVSLSALAAGFLISGCSDDNSRPNTPPADAPPSDGAQPPGVLQLKTLSNRADLVSGGDVLVEIVIPPGSPSTPLHVMAGATDVSDRFAKVDGRTVGLLTGLAESPTGAATVITADIGGAQKASLTVTNHPIGGPVISGPQVTPWVCALPLGKTPTSTDPGAFDNGLGQPPTDAQCNAPTLVKLYYRTTANPPACTLAIPDPSKQSPAGLASPPAEGAATPPTDPCFKPYDASSPAPSDLAMTTTDAGVAVPYIVQVERGTLNRGIYDIAVLIDPTQGSWKPTAPNRAWNRKLLYLFGASTNQPRFQQRSSQQWSGQDDALKRGFMVAMNNLTDSNLNSNRVSMTETLMMMKEHIVDTYGELRFAMGAGCSGGSINQLTASSIYPGLLDGIQPSCTYPDSETTAMEVADCELLVRVYASDAWKALVPEADRAAKQKAINGHFDDAGCRSWFNSFSGRGRPGQYDAERANADGTITVLGRINNCGLPEALVYEPNDRPTAPRCTPQDHAASVWGQVPGPGTAFHAPTTRDNVGVVYGRQAFLDKVISQEEFVLLNEKVGGSDFDTKHTDARSVADSSALEIAYKSGIVMDGHQLRKTPILDVRGFDESGIHYIWRSFSLRARLDAAGGHANHVLWRFPTALTPPAASKLTLQSFDAMDKWLTALRGDTSATAIEQRVVSDKPAEGFDFCYLALDAGFTVKVTDPAICNLDPRLRPNKSPRQVAGGPVTEDILKCQLKPFDAADYPGLDADHQTRLAAVFPDGVCDWTKPGVGQQDAQSPRDFSGGPGGAPLPAAPVSKAAD